MTTVSPLDALQETSPEVGTLTALDYHHATVLTNDSLISAAGGVPEHAFLLAVPPQAEELLLLKVEGVAQLEDSRSLRALRESLSAIEVKDVQTRQKLQTMGYSCNVVGSFYEVEGSLRFGADMESLLAYSSYKVLRPRGKSLSLIASFTRPHPGGPAKQVLDLGVVRYTDSQRHPDAEAKVFVDVRDFIGKKSALFGATRTGKSNSIKVLTQQVFEYSKALREPIGQIIFDPQGEYANENVQDGGALASMGTGKDVVIYRTHLKNDQSYERPLLLNFLEEENLQLLWDLMLLELEAGMSARANYTAGLSSIDFHKPDKKKVQEAQGEAATAAYPQLMNHYQRRRLGLYAFLKLCRIDGPISNLYLEVGKEHVTTVVDLVEDNSITPSPTKPGEVRVTSTAAAKVLFEWLVETALGKAPAGEDGTVKPRKPKGEEELTGPIHVTTLSPSWVKDLQEGDMAEFVKQFDNYYAGRTGLVAAFSRLKPLHSTDSKGDIREIVWEDLEKGRVIIVDLSRGSSSTSVVLSELLVNSIIKHASERFTSGLDPVKIQVVVEEAHNLFDRNGAADDSTDPWVRLSKEAAKYSIGLLYATQEVSSVDPRILSNTSNWIIAHLNSKKETRELANYYSFEEWGDQIRRSEGKGFVRLKTESSPFIVPVQVHKFVPKRGY